MLMVRCLVFFFTHGSWQNVQSELIKIGNNKTPTSTHQWLKQYVFPWFQTLTTKVISRFLSSYFSRGNIHEIIPDIPSGVVSLHTLPEIMAACFGLFGDFFVVFGLQLSDPILHHKTWGQYRSFSFVHMQKKQVLLWDFNIPISTRNKRGISIGKIFFQLKGFILLNSHPDLSKGVSARTTSGVKSSHVCQASDGWVDQVWPPLFLNGTSNHLAELALKNPVLQFSWYVYFLSVSLFDLFLFFHLSIDTQTWCWNPKCSLQPAPWDGSLPPMICFYMNMLSTTHPQDPQLFHMPLHDVRER